MAESGVQITAANAWVEKLVTGTVLAQKLFAQQLVLSENGQIKSENYQAGQSGFQIRADGTAEFNNSIFRGMLYAQGGRFENVEIRNCTGNISFTVTAGNNFVLKTMADLVPEGSSNYYSDSVRIVASGTVRLSFSISCSVWNADASWWVWSIKIKAIGGKLFVNGVQQVLSGHNFNGSFVFDLPITAGETITARAYWAWDDRNSQYTKISITSIQLLVKDNPGVLSVLN